MTKKRFTEITGIGVVTREIIGDDAVKLAAVQRDGLAIRYIANPSEAVQLAAVEQDALAIQYFKDSWFDAE